MIRKALFSVFRSGIVVAGATILALLANSASSDDAAPSAPSPPAQPPIGQTIADFIKQSGFNATQLVNAPWAFDVDTNYNGYGKHSMRITEQAAPWKSSDGTDVRYVTYSVPVTPFYPKKTDVPDELTNAIAEANQNYNWLKFSLLVSEKSKDWSVFCETQVFLQGMNYDTFETYIEVICGAVHDKEGPFAKYVADSSGTGN